MIGTGKCSSLLYCDTATITAVKRFINRPQVTASRCDRQCSNFTTRSSSKHRSSSSRHRKSTRLTDSSFDTVHWRSEDFLERDIADKVKTQLSFFKNFMILCCTLFTFCPLNNKYMCVYVYMCVLGCMFVCVCASESYLISLYVCVCVCVCA